MKVVLADDGRAVIFDRVSGQTLRCSVPTAVENVTNGKGQWVHGETGEPWDGPASQKVTEAPAPIVLSQDDVLPLPAADEHKPIRPVSDEHRHVPAHDEPDPLDHDGDGGKGGSSKRPGADPERVALFAALDAKGLKYFKGASTEKLKAKLAAS